MRMRSIFLRGVALAAVLTLFTVGSAFAAGFVAPTSTALGVSDTSVDVGTRVTFTGTLHSGESFCRNNSDVTLRMFGHDGSEGGVVDSMETTGGGHFEFTVLIHEQTKFRAWFRGKVGGVHPNIKVCQKSRSDVIKVEIS